MEIARVCTYYILLGPERDKRITSIKEAFEEIKQRYDIYGKVSITDISLVIKLIQKPQNVRSALEDLFSQAGIPHRINPPEFIMDEQGYKIAQESLNPLGYSLNHGFVVRKKEA